jgi:hypothetical protein
MRVNQAAPAGFRSPVACANEATYASCVELHDAQEPGGVRELWEFRGARYRGDLRGLF